MSRRIGQLVARGDDRWLVRVFLGRDRTTQKRLYYNRTIQRRKEFTPENGSYETEQ